MKPRSKTWLLAFTLAGGIGSLLALGCQPAASTLAEGDFWDAVFIQGSKVGYSHTVVRPQTIDGQPRLVANSESDFTILRYGEMNRQQVKMTSIETLAGGLLSFECEATSGPSSSKAVGKVEGKSLRLTITQGAQTQSADIPWSSDILGFASAEQNLRDHPMKPGEERSLTTFVPLLNLVAKVRNKAIAVEPVELLDGKSHDLLRIESQMTLSDGNRLDSTLWTDSAGETMKSAMAAMQQETFRTSESVARTPGKVGEFDLGKNSMVQLDPPLENAHATKRVKYRVELTGGNPLDEFAQCPSQQVKLLDAHTAEITVLAIRPGVAAEEKIVEPTPQDLAHNSFIQADDPKIIELGRSVAADEKDPWQVAVALEKLVHTSIKKKNFSQAFATASEVAASREGDCTEHAVLLAALLRSRGIPARVAIGLVYVASDQALGYHMWTEALVDGQWIPLDATLGRGGIGGGHLKLVDTNLEGASALSAFLPVAKVLGQLKINVLETE